MGQLPDKRSDKPRYAWRTRSYLLIALVTLIVGAYLLRSGWWVSVDGLHHLHRAAALTRYLDQGVLYPRWIGEFAFGYGVPAFNFYSPLSYYFAQLFAPLGADWAVKLTMLAGLFASGLFVYLFARSHVGLLAAVIASVIYVAAPYRLVDLYPRAALAEHLAFVWPPLILWAYDGLRTGRRRVWQVIGWAGLVLTHSFTALMFAPFFALYVLWSARRLHQGRQLLQALASLLLAVGLTAFFWLPLMWEAQYAGLDSRDDGRGYRNHLVRPVDLVGPWLYDYTTGEGRADYYFAFGAVPTGVLLLSAAATVSVARRAKRSVQCHAQGTSRALGMPGAFSETEATFLPTYGIVVCLAALFVVSRPAQTLWDALAPVLAPVQFPWRFLGTAVFGLALASTGLTEALRRMAPGVRVFGGKAPLGDSVALTTGGILIALLLVTSLARLPFSSVSQRPLGVHPESLWAFDRDTGQAGTTWAGEFLPVGVREQRWALGRAPEAPRDGPALPPISVNMVGRRGDGFVLNVESDQPWAFRLHAFYFPGWQVRVDSIAVPTAASGDMGLVTAEISSGAHRLAVTFESTPARRIGKTLATLALVALPYGVGWSISGRRRLAAIGWAVLVVLMLWVVVPALPQTVEPTPIRAVFGDQAQLVGAEVTEVAQPGQLLPVDLFWLATREISRDDKVFLHLVDAQGQVVAQHDGDPGGGFTPTSRWQPGELLRDRHYLELPENLQPGRYQLKAGLYRFDPFQNLLTDPVTPDGRVDVGEVIIQ